MINKDIIEYKNIVVLYHGDCMDGFASSYVAWREFGDKAEYIACKDRINLPDYIINHNDKNNTEIYLLDFSFPIDKLLYMQNNFKKLTMIDHHISAEQNIKSLREYVFALNKSGAVLSWEYFYKDKPIPLLLQYISDNDIWTHQMPDWEIILSYIFSFDFIEKQDYIGFEKLLNELQDKNNYENIKKIGMILNKITERDVNKYIEKATLINFQGYDVYAVNCDTKLRNIIGNKLAEKTGTFSIIYYYDASINAWKLSLRSIKDFDLVPIVSKYNGGGHKNAAAFILPAKHPFISIFN